jgi:type II secretory pathway component PulF
MSDELLRMLIIVAVLYAPTAIAAFPILLGRRAAWFGIFASAWFVLMLVALIAGLFVTGKSFGALALLLTTTMGIGWLFYAYRRYLQGRQEEVFQVIATAIESNMPLARALQAYLLDRPRDGRALWDAGLLLACPPGFIVWNLRRTFDDKVALLSTMIDAGAPLPTALRIARGVASREVRVAADVGCNSGRLAACLRRTDQDALAGVWLEILPRMLYPLLLLMFIFGITTYLSIRIVPKFKRIFDDFKEPLPPVTNWLIAAMSGFGDWAWLLVLAAIGAFWAAVWLVFSPSARWHLPLFGRLFRWETQGMVLRMLGALFEVGRPAPEALDLLADAPDLPTVARRRLDQAKCAVERGEPLAESLHAVGLLPSSMAPLVLAAERSHSLPFALSELGRLLAGKAVGMARRASFVIGPLLIVCIGMLVCFIVVGMFMPLIQLLSRLCE